MRTRLLVAVLTLLFSATVATGQDALFGIREIPAGIPDIAMASYDQMGPVIYFNPAMVQKLKVTNPNMLKFILAHEYAHHRFGHIQHQMYAGGNFFLRMKIAQQGEIEADQYATDYWVQRDTNVIKGAISFMLSPGTANWGDWTHLPTPVRAQLINQRASQAIAKQSDPSSEGGRSEVQSLSTKPFSYFVAKSRHGVTQLKEGPDVTGLGIWDSSIKFPGASSTNVQRESGEYSIEAYFKRDSVTDAKRIFSDLLERAKADLGDTWKYNVSKSAMPGGNRAYWKASITNTDENVDIAITFMEMKSGPYKKVIVSFIPH